MSSRVKFMLAVVFAVFGLSTRSRGLDIVRDGQAVVVIVAQRDSDSGAQSQDRRSRNKRAQEFDCSDQMAAEVLVDWIEKMTTPD